MPGSVGAFRFTRPSKSHLTYQLLSIVNSGRLKMYQADESTDIDLRRGVEAVAAGKVSDTGTGDDGFLCHGHRGS